jgi:hypothetical protein
MNIALNACNVNCPFCSLIPTEGDEDSSQILSYYFDIHYSKIEHTNAVSLQGEHAAHLKKHATPEYKGNMPMPRT